MKTAIYIDFIVIVNSLIYHFCFHLSIPHFFIARSIHLSAIDFISLSGKAGKQSFEPE